MWRGDEALFCNCCWGGGGGLNGLGDVTMIGGDDWRDKFLDILTLDVVEPLDDIEEASDTRLKGDDDLLVGILLLLLLLWCISTIDEGEVFTVNLCNVSIT